jgi:hypothetical protein
MLGSGMTFSESASMSIAGIAFAAIIKSKLMGTTSTAPTDISQAVFVLVAFTSHGAFTDE